MRRKKRSPLARKVDPFLPFFGMLCFAALLLCLLYGCGKDGAPGPQGAPGMQGPKGDTGATGSPGLDATLNAYAIVAIIDPCGDAPGVIDEVVLQLANGQYLVSLSDKANGQNTRFAILPPGSYVTTDGSSCTFTI